MNADMRYKIIRTVMPLRLRAAIVSREVANIGSTISFPLICLVFYLVGIKH